ncbi:HD domain-containing protein [Clostridium gasigenes]|uniref:3'-5' exoribonuclease n=1 Tax=Clostridium gasigenes TaxID=94869 RepID=A0A1H0NAI2_9CLOT|nr:HD domain-containing protein [Clostridium gasigenes]MBB6623869.1 HD domain-containing protein [Clostridium gasigenes]MBB6715983.1 HD domain-containing protein [Clostridium gasigenes]MBU3087415.1 HD domain-containing protein [Clostridium gasigenes]MBU3103032.1 HD domain-containing protein [Clostridium gasigenes]MBU3131632.1 HD domain-containing protein [Clostridium gasigenes]
MKEKYLNEVKIGEKVEMSLMIIKILSRDELTMTAYIGDKTKEVKAVLKDEKKKLTVGHVVKTKGTYGNLYKAEVLQIIEDFDLRDYVPSVKRPVEDIMKELEELTSIEFKSPEVISLNNYFFKDEKFLERFTKAIGGVYQHHNYLGGLAEHTLGVTYLAKMFADRYNCRHKEIAILGAKLHDIGKIKEMNYDGPFTYSLEGEMEGHIVIGVTMLEEAFRANPELYTHEFRQRIKGIIVQHHGKLEYGSPKTMKSQESYIVHYSDYVDSTMNKIDIVMDGVEEGEWTSYERRMDGKLFV